MIFFSSTPPVVEEAIHKMATEEHDQISNGWPLGLEAMSMRLRVPENVPSAPAPRPCSFQGRCSSFSSFSSSNLDTESTASFFQDNSVSLGRLIGFRHRDGGRGGTLYIRNSISIEEHSKKAGLGDCGDGSEKHGGVDTSRGHCVPLLLGTLVRINKNKRKSKQLDA